MFKPIMIEDNCYKIKMEDHTYYINRDTKFIEKEIIEENSYITVELEKDVVTDEDVAKPE